MTTTEYKVGQVLESSHKQFTKIISERNGLFGLSGWTTRANAEKATRAIEFRNEFGLRAAHARVVSEVKKGGSRKSAPATSTPDAVPSAPAATTDATVSTTPAGGAPAAPKKGTAKKVAKKAAKKTAAKKSTSKSASSKK